MGRCALELPFNNISVDVYTDQLDAFIYPNVKNFFSKVVQSDSICLDIGAHVGLISLLLGYIAFNGQVYSFEPSDKIYSLLEQNVKEHKLHNIKAINKAIFNNNARMNFCNIENGSGSSHICLLEDHHSNQETSCVRIDDWIAEEKIEKLDLIKMDIEGAEIEALRSAITTINQLKPDLVIEFNSDALTNMGHEPEDLFYFLRELYPEIYLIQPDSSLIKIESYSTLISLTDTLKDFYQINFNNGDLYCTFK